MVNSKRVQGAAWSALLALCLAGPASAASSQPPPEGEMRPDQATLSPQDKEARRAERKARILKKIQAVHAARVGAALELSAEEGAKVYPLLSAIQKERHEAHQRTRKAHAALKTALRGGGEGLEAAREAVIQARKKMRSLEAAMIEKVCGVLSPRKCAQYTLLAPEIEREVRQAIRRLRKQGKRGRRGQHMGEGGPQERLDGPRRGRRGGHPRGDSGWDAGGGMDSGLEGDSRGF